MNVEEEALSFIHKLGHTREIKYITDVIVDHLHQPWRTFASIINKYLCGKIDNIDSKKQDKMFYPRFIKIIIHHFLVKDKSISMRNRMFMYTVRDDSLLGTIRFVSRHADTQVYGAILPQAMTNQALLDSVSYKTYYAITSGAKPPVSKKSQKKSDSAILSEESPSKKKSAKDKKFTAPKPKPTKKKTLVKADKGKGLNVLSEVAISKVAQLKKATKQSKKDFHISQSIGSDDGTNFESRVPDEQHLKITGADERTDDENDSDDKSDDGDDDDDDANDDDNQEGHDTNDDDEETDSDRTESNRIKIPVLNQSSTEYYEEEEENIDDEETMDEEEDDEVTKELYKDVNVNLGNEDTDITNADQADNEIASLMDTTACHATVVPEITSVFTTTIPPPPSFLNPLLQQATSTPTPPTSVATTSFPSLLDFSSVFKFNDRVTNLEKDMSKINKLTTIQKAIVAHNLDYREEAQAEKRNYIELADTSMRTILKEEVNTQLPYILPQALSDFAIPCDREKRHRIIRSYNLGKRSRDDSHKDRDPSAESDRGTKRRKSSKEAESYRDSRSKEKKSSSTSKDASHSQQKPSGKSAHVEEPSHIVDESGRVEDLQLGVESYQKKLILTKPDTFRSNLRNMTTYTAYSDPKGVIYKDQNDKNRLMRTDELHKFSDDMLNDVRTTLNDIAKGIRMEYLPKRKWSGLEKRRAWVMVQDIDKQLYEQRLMRNLEKFVGGKEYVDDLRLLERII
nr:hypothetical protein [Tanacetum cinerariifolium]GEV66926.1 hypothetical protein [Tanacetum cinerariifolium]